MAGKIINFENIVRNGAQMLRVALDRSKEKNEIYTYTRLLNSLEQLLINN